MTSQSWTTTATYGYGVLSDLFTGKERDVETGLDWFNTRYFSGAQGRFTSPDAPFNDQNPSDPQSWNLFSYGRNNPLRFSDPTGTTTCDENGNNCHDDVTVNGGRGDDVSYAWSLLRSFGSQAAQTAANITDTTLQYLAAPRDPGCVGRAASIGAAAGGVVGGVLGAGAGGTGGALAGAPAGGFGAIPGAALGGSAGFAEGTAYGTLAGGALGGAVGFITCASGTGGGSGGGGGGQGLGGHKSSTKWANQLAKRGWTEQQIDEAIANGRQFPAPNNVNPANGATRFVHPTTGRSVVIDNVTREVLHVGGDGFKY